MTTHDEALQSYIEVYPPHHEFRETWPVQGEMIVRIGLTNTPPPVHVSSSILAIVFDTKNRVLFLWPSDKSGNISHLLIGGRPNLGESPEETATREVGEETGWRILPVGIIGYRHFHQLEPKSKKSDRPYPDFVQLIYAARTVSHDPDLLISSDQIPATFLELSNALESTNQKHRPLLIAAANALAKSKV